VVRARPPLGEFGAVHLDRRQVADIAADFQELPATPAAMFWAYSTAYRRNVTEWLLADHLRKVDDRPEGHAEFVANIGQEVRLCAPRSHPRTAQDRPHQTFLALRGGKAGT
jgi:hypothetical protein